MENNNIVDLSVFRDQISTKQDVVLTTSEQPEDLGTAIQELIERMRNNRAYLQKAN